MIRSTTCWEGLSCPTSRKNMLLDDKRMLISTIMPGASYANSTFTIPWSSISDLTTNDVTASDSFERLLHGLIMVVLEKQNNGTLTQVNCAAEVSSVSQSQGVVETATNTFSDRLLWSALVTFDCGGTLTPLYLDGDTVQSR